MKENKRLGVVEVDTEDEEFIYMLYADKQGKLKVVNCKNIGFFRHLIIDLLFS